MKTIKLYHGSIFEIESFRVGKMYFTDNEDEAKSIAEIQGNFETNIFIYSVEINIDDIIETNDFIKFDNGLICNEIESNVIKSSNIENSWYLIKDVTIYDIKEENYYIY